MARRWTSWYLSGMPQSSSGQYSAPMGVADLEFKILLETVVAGVEVVVVIFKTRWKVCDVLDVWFVACDLRYASANRRV